MPDQSDTQQLEEEIKLRYPYPIAATFHRVYRTAEDDSERHDYLLDLFEVVLKYCASIALSQYFSDSQKDPKINASLLALQRPFLGHWHGWLRDILSFYRHKGQQLLIPELDTFYTYRDTGPLLHAYTSLRQFMIDQMRYDIGRNLGVTRPQDIFELLVAYRNRLAHRARPSRPDLERVAHIIAPAMLHLLGMLRPVADYPPVSIRSVRLRPDSTPQNPYYDHQYTSLTGDPQSRQLKPIGHIAAYPQRLYLLAKKEDFKPILSLHPFFIFTYCVGCNQERVFMLNEIGERKLDYVSYQCPHDSSPNEYLKDMQLLIGNLTITPEDEAKIAREEAEQRARKEAERLELERAAQQALEEERLLREAVQRQAREEALKREEEQRQELARLEKERLSREEAAHRASENGQQQTQEEAESHVSTASASVPGRPFKWRVALPFIILLLAGIIALIGFIQLFPTSNANSVSLDTLYTINYTASVISVAFSPDGQTLASASKDDKVRLWNVTDGTPVRALEGQTINGSSVAFSPDGQILASAPRDNTIRLWNAKDGSALRTLEGHTAPVNSVAFSPDGKILASASDDHKVRLWNTKDDSPLHTLEGHASFVISVAFSPDGQTLASTSWDKKIRLWSVNDGMLLHALEGHTGYVWRAAFSPDGQTLASASWDNKIRLWSVKDGTPLGTLEGHAHFVNSVAFFPNGQILASASSDKTIRLWNAKDGTPLRAFAGHTLYVNSIVLSPDGKLLASGGEDGKIIMWSIK